MATTPTLHQGFQNLPKLDSPFVDSGQRITIPWYRFLISLWNRTGAATGGGGGPAQSVALGPSPFEWFALVQPGQLVISAGWGATAVGPVRTEISRDGGVTWTLAGNGSTAVRLLTNDGARLTWTGPRQPTVEFLPG